MAGGLPTGSNPGYITPHPFSVIGAGFAALNDRNEANVRATLQSQVQTNPDLVALSGQVFAGINAQLGVVGGILEAFFHRILGSIPFIDHEAIESAAEQILDQVDAFFGNWRHFLHDINFLDPDFDPSAAVEDFVGGMIYPLNMLATLVSGVIPGVQIPGLDASKITSGIMSLTRLPAELLTTASELAAGLITGVLSAVNIPGLDASKIVSGQFAQSFVTGLETGLSNLWTGISTASGDLVRAVVKGATGTVDELAQWGQNVLSGDWMQQLSVALLGKPGNLGDIQDWANSLRKSAEKIPMSLIDGLNNIGQMIHVGLIGKPTTSPNLLSNPDFSLPVDTSDGFYWEGPQIFLFTVSGTLPQIGHAPANTGAIGRAVDEELWSVFPIDYGAYFFPMRNSIDGGKTKLVDAIAALKPGTKFAFTGESQGAVVCSEVYEDELLNVAGSLHDRLPDFVAATMCGNPRRKAGSYAPGTTDPGTNGIAQADLMPSRPTFWYDYTNPGDIVAATPSGTAGTWMSNVYDFLTDDWDGTPLDLITDIVGIFGNPFGSDLRDVFGAVNQMVGTLGGFISSGVNPHTGYGTIKIDGTNTSYELATAYLDTVGAAYAPVVGTDFEDHTAGGSGSLTIVADGGDHKWVHPDSIAVAKDQVITVSAWRKTAAGYTGTGTPLRVGLVTYNDGVEIGTQTLAQGGASGTWGELTGTYTVPTGVDEVRICVLLTPSATGGKVNFDDLSLTKTGLLQKSFVAGLEASLEGFVSDISTGATNLANLISDLWNNPVSVINNLLASMVPSLDASKIISGVFGPSVIPGLDAAKIVSGQFLSSLIPNLNAAIITAGTFLTSLIPALDASKITTGLLNILRIPDFDAGKITSGLLNILRIPDFDAAKIISGTLAALRIPTLDASKIVSGQFLTSLIPNLNASIITAGTFLTSLIPNLNASIINAGTFLSSLIPALDASKITTGLLNILRIPDFDAGKIVSGFLSRFRIGIPDFENLAAGSDFEGTHPWLLGGGASIATDQAHSGTKSLKLVNGQSVTVLGDASTTLNFEVKPGDQIYMECWARKSSTYVDSDPTNNYPRIRCIRATGPSAGTTINNILLLASSFTASDTWEKKTVTVTIPDDGTTSVYFAIHSLLTTSAGSVWVDDIVIRRVKEVALIPGLDVSKIISGVFGAIRIPSLDASKIISGQFLTSLIPNLNASIITAGTFLSSLIPNLNASIINAGTFLTSLIPALDASKITSGQFLTSLIPNLNASIITAGTFLSSLIPNLNASIINAGTFLSSLIPSLDASKITSGQFAQSFITNLTSDLSARVKSTILDAFAGGSNLFISPNFEDSTITRFMYNGAGSFGYTTAQAKSGTQSYFWTATGTWNGICLSPTNTQRYHAVREGDSFRVKVKVKPHASNNTATGTVQVFLRCWTNPDGTGTSTDIHASGASPRSINNSALTSGWNSLEAVGTVPAGYSSMDIMLLSQDTTAVGNVYYVDEVSVREETTMQVAFTNLFNSKNPLSTILASVVPALDAAKITTGTFLTSLIPNLNASIITAGTFLSSLIPNLNASIINAGTFLSSLIPSLDATKITSGTFITSLIPNITKSMSTDLTKMFGLNTYRNIGGNLVVNSNCESNIFAKGNAVQTSAQAHSGTYSMMLTGTGGYPNLPLIADDTSALRIPAAPGDIFYGEFWIRGDAANTSPAGTAFIQIDCWDSSGSQIATYPSIVATSTFTTGMNSTWTKFTGYSSLPVPANTVAVNITLYLRNDVPVGYKYYVDDIVVYRVTETNVITKALYNANTTLSNILSSVVPSLDASKITSGTFLTSLIPNLNASIINAGTFLTSLIPNLNASIINAGTFVASLIPALDASKITTGVINALRIPDITAAMSSGITNANNALQSLYETLYNGVKGVPLIGATLANILAGFNDLMTKLFANVVPQTTVTPTVVPLLSPTKIDPTGGHIDQQNVPDVQAWMSTDTQAIIDGVHQVANGGDSTGNPVDSIVTNLQKIISPPESPSVATAVTVDAVGAGGSANHNSASSSSANWTHTIGGSANMLVVSVVWESGPIDNVGGTAAFKRTVLVGASAGTGVPMTSILVSKGSSSFSEIFILKNPPTGAKVITASVQSTSNYLGGQFCDGLEAQSISLIGFGKLGATVINSGSGSTSLSHAVSAVNSNAQVVQAFVTERPSAYTGASITSYNKTQDRYSGNYIQGIRNVGPVNLPTGAAFLAGHATGASTVTFTANQTSSGDNWYSIAVVFLPSEPDPIGSGFHRTRVSTSGFTLASGSHTLPDGWFDTASRITADLTYSATGNTVTVAHAGWYSVNICFNGNHNTTTTDTASAAILYRNGTIEQFGPKVVCVKNVYAYTPFVGVGGNFIVYCNAGDTLQPGYWADGNNSGASIIGDADGDATYWSISLLNRSLQ